MIITSQVLSSTCVSDNKQVSGVE